MHARVLLTLGVGVAVGSVCRPRSIGVSQSLPISTMETSTVLSIIADESGLYSTIESFSSATETAATETLTVAQTTTETTESTATEIATSNEPTTEAAKTSAETTSIETQTTTALAETTTSSSPSIPTLFNLMASSGPAKDTYLRGTSTTAFFNAEVGSNLELSIEAPTNRLRWDDLYICASYNYRLKTATLTPCTVSTDDSPYITCDAPAGDTIQCSVPDCRMYQYHSEVPPYEIIEAMQCREDKAPWTHFYTRKHGETEWYAGLGAQDVTDVSFTAVDVKVVPS